MTDVYALRALANVDLNVPLRGNRAYVQFSDLLSALDDLAKVKFSATMRLRNLALRKMAFHEVEAHFKAHDRAFGTFEFCDGQIRVTGWLVETGRKIMRRKPYDEAPVRNAAIVQPGRAFLSSPIKGYTACDQAIILLKILGAQLKSGHWLVAKIDLEKSFAEQLPVDIALVQTIMGRSQVIDVRQQKEAVARIQTVLRQDGGA